MNPRHWLLVAVALMLLSAPPAAVATAGDPDPSFGGGDGDAFESIGASAGFAAMAVQPDGKVLLAGSTADSQGTDRRAPIVRLTAAGVPDPSFGGRDGVVTEQLDTSNSPAHYSVASALALQPDG